MLRILFLILILMSSFVFAQSSDEVETYQIDEFGRIGNCDASARIDNLFITLNNNKNSKGYVIHYKSANSLPARFEKMTWTMKQLLQSVYFRNYDQSRIKFIEGGFREEEITEIWVVPENGKIPKPTNTVPKPTIPKHKTFLYDKSILYADFGEFQLPAVIEEYYKEFDEPHSDDEFETELSKEEREIKEAERFYWLSADFGKFLKNGKVLQGVIVFYADAEQYDIDKLTLFIENGRKKLADEAKLPSSKIQIFYGGYRSDIETEFWVINKNSGFPEITPQIKENEHSTNK